MQLCCSLTRRELHVHANSFLKQACCHRQRSPKHHKPSCLFAASHLRAARSHDLNAYPWRLHPTHLNAVVQVVYEWAQGTAFEDICKLTDVQEGIIVRTIVRLDETCREFRDAARVMGNTQLFQQMSEASAAIKRDVIFAASLYVA